MHYYHLKEAITSKRGYPRACVKYSMPRPYAPRTSAHIDSDAGASGVGGNDRGTRLFGFHVHASDDASAGEWRRSVGFAVGGVTVSGASSSSYSSCPSTNSNTSSPSNIQVERCGPAPSTGAAHARAGEGRGNHHFDPPQTQPFSLKNSSRLVAFVFLCSSCIA